MDGLFATDAGIPPACPASWRSWLSLPGCGGLYKGFVRKSDRLLKGRRCQKEENIFLGECSSVGINLFNLLLLVGAQHHRFIPTSFAGLH